jgi:hypothetical protein
VSRVTQSLRWPTRRSRASRASIRDHGVELDLPLLGIGLEQIVEARLVAGIPVHDHRLRRPAGEDVPAQPGALAHLLGCLADRLQAAQAQGQGGCEFLGARLLALRRLGEQEAGLEIGQPGGHHEVVRRQLQAHTARRLDEGDVLLGQGQDRDAVEVHLLAASEFEQQVERPFEPVHVDEQSGFALGPLGGFHLLEG